MVAHRSLPEGGEAEAFVCRLLLLPLEITSDAPTNGHLCLMLIYDATARDAYVGVVLGVAREEERRQGGLA